MEEPLPVNDTDEPKWVRRREVASRLKTVEGQLRAVRRMVMSGEECLVIATQAAAALEGLRGAMKIVLRNYMDDCLEPEAVECNREEVYDQFIGVLERFIR
ncbi:MAG: metal-sensitive transcriptional regulator [Gemmatimonadales bacterium]|jgi:DNA-binding FrmR family transcriptional regulator